MDTKTQLKPNTWWHNIPPPSFNVFVLWTDEAEDPQGAGPGLRWGRSSLWKVNTNRFYFTSFHRQSYAVQFTECFTIFLNYKFPSVSMFCVGSLKYELLSSSLIVYIQASVFDSELFKPGVQRIIKLQPLCCLEHKHTIYTTQIIWKKKSWTKLWGNPRLA